MTRLALLLTLALAGQQAYPPEILDLLKQLADLGRKAEQLLAPPPEPTPLPPPQTAPTTMVKAGDDLQQALNNGGAIELQAGASFSSTRFVVWHTGTSIKGNGAALHGTTGPALYIPPDVDNVAVSDLVGTSASSGAVFQCGDNGSTQTAISQQPTGISFTRVKVPTHRGKRGLEINCSATVTDSSVLDTWSSALADSQGLWVGNSCGPVTVTGGEYVAASENIMIGGDTLKILDCPEKVQPDYWRTDGVSRAVKNLFEVKAGKRVTLRNSTLSGSWKASQDGWAIVITPRNSLYVDGVLIENVTVDRCGGALQLLGKDSATVTPQATSGIVVRNSAFHCDKATHLGRGIYALVTGGVLDMLSDNILFVGDGNALVQSDSQGVQGPFIVRNSRATIGQYGVMAPGSNFGTSVIGTSYEPRAFLTTLDNNRFLPVGMSSTGLNLFKANYPGNTYVTTTVELEAPR
jgi:hypothetical protein